MKRHWVSLLVLAWVVGACSHQVTVYSEPPGAEIFVNGARVGPSPALFTERSGFHKKFSIRAELPGYEPWTEEHEQKKPSKLLAPSLVGGYVLLVPFVGVLWGYQLEDEIMIVLEAPSKP